MHTVETAFAGGPNIAMKVPHSVWPQTIAFYRDVLGLKAVGEETTGPPSICFEFGAARLWIDRVQGLDRAEIWLELTAGNLTSAAKHLENAGVGIRDDTEPLPDDVPGFWIQNPAAVVHLVSVPDPRMPSTQCPDKEPQP